MGRLTISFMVLAILAGCSETKNRPPLQEIVYYTVSDDESIRGDMQSRWIEGWTVVDIESTTANGSTYQYIVLYELHRE